MNQIRKRRLTLIGLSACGMALAVGLILYALKQNINAFLTPSDIKTVTRPISNHIRLGGMVKRGSVKRDPHSLAVTFTVTDLKQDMTVHYTGILPDLFKEGTGVIADGELNNQGEFMANQILAKHDEKYMPKQLSKQKVN